MLNNMNSDQKLLNPYVKEMVIKFIEKIKILKDPKIKGLEINMIELAREAHPDISIDEVRKSLSVIDVHGQYLQRTLAELIVNETPTDLLKDRKCTFTASWGGSPALRVF